MATQFMCPRCNEPNYPEDIFKVDLNTGDRLSVGSFLGWCFAGAIGILIMALWWFVAEDKWDGDSLIPLGFGIMLASGAARYFAQIAARVSSTLRKLECSECGYRWNLVGAVNDRTAIDLLIENLKDEDVEFRKKAAAVLANVADVRGKEALIEAVKDKDWDVRCSAVTALGYMKDPDVFELLVRVMQDRGSGVQIPAIDAVSSFGISRMLVPLIKVMRKGDRSVRLKAYEKLGLFKSEEIVEPLIDGLSDEKLDVRQMSAVLLGNQGDERAMEALRQAEKSDALPVRRAAKGALNKIRHDMGTVGVGD